VQFSGSLRVCVWREQQQPSPRDDGEAAVAEDAESEAKEELQQLKARAANALCRSLKVAAPLEATHSFDELDADGDGVITREEYEAAAARARAEQEATPKAKPAEVNDVADEERKPSAAEVSEAAPAAVEAAGAEAGQPPAVSEAALASVEAAAPPVAEAEKPRPASAEAETQAAKAAAAMAVEPRQPISEPVLEGLRDASAVGTEVDVGTPASKAGSGELALVIPANDLDEEKAQIGSVALVLADPPPAYLSLAGRVTALEDGNARRCTRLEEWVSRLAKGVEHLEARRNKLAEERLQRLESLEQCLDTLVDGLRPALGTPRGQRPPGSMVSSAR